MYTGEPKKKKKNPKFIYKKLCICSHIFTLQSPSNYSPFDAIHLLRHFSHCSKQFFKSLILMPFSASAFFCFTYPTQYGLIRCTRKSPIMKWGTHWKSLQKRSTEAKHSLSLHHQLVHRYRWVPRTLTWGWGDYKGPTLQKITLGFFWGGSPLLFPKFDLNHSCHE